jgi:hypothetical protein
MDPIGLGFEHYDALGQWRDFENGIAIDATGQVTGTDVAGPFNGAVEMAHKLASSEQVKDCLTQTWFRFAQGRSISDQDAQSLTQISERFAQGSHQISALLVALTQSDSFRYHVVADPSQLAPNQEAP